MCAVVNYYRGPIVTMVLQIITEIKPYLMVVMILLVGFSMAFTLALGPDVKRFANPGRAFFWLSTVGLMSDPGFILDYQGTTEHFSGIVLYEAFILMLSLILLNLLIVIMGDATEQVRRHARELCRRSNLC